MNKQGYVPFVDEVAFFNETMGKSYQNRSQPEIDLKDAQFVLDFIREETDEMEQAIREGDIVEILDAIEDLLYVAIGNAVNVFGLREKLMDGFKEVQESNLSKICDTEEDAIATTEAVSKDKGHPCHYEKVGDRFVVYRSSDNKVMKSLKYFRPNLKKFFTEDELQNVSDKFDDSISELFADVISKDGLLTRRSETMIKNKSHKLWLRKAYKYVHEGKHQHYTALLRAYDDLTN